ncbi:glycoside hydrolase family 5 protein [Paraglaciecola hydrolytica]|uniref:Glycoside hydrolase n=1 Tax=Paraglaciecola hydrolytica TaxID=1799789 RepID=A0A136A673_9ALTE|nr:glycoside hydrolase family 5 protein [Paraglaciecola hydrolytica]KXI30726.1 glycoside hydrolase [Paraglaciecola hydrolytica]
MAKLNSSNLVMGLLLMFCCLGAYADAKSPALTSFDRSKLSQPQSLIRVSGNKLLDESGKQVILRGVNIADPAKIFKQQQWSLSLFTELKAWGVNVIRLPVHPSAWRTADKDNYLALLDEAVSWANSLSLYLIIDWHSIGYLPSNTYQDKMYDTTLEETKEFWHIIAQRYKNVPTIAVYELFNEPTDLGQKAGKANWLDWKNVNEQLIDIIYAQDKNVIPLVAGFNWAYDLRPIAEHPIERAGIAYTSHPYPQKTSQDLNSNKDNNFTLWQRDWGFAASDYPVIVTELGWVQADGYGAHIPVKNDGSYGPQIVEFMEQRNISWVVWVFDPNWSPTMISDWQFTPTEQGAFFKQQLLKLNN